MFRLIIKASILEDFAFWYLWVDFERVLTNNYEFEKIK